jgi:hypothetical protein
LLARSSDVRPDLGHRAVLERRLRGLRLAAATLLAAISFLVLAVIFIGVAVVRDSLVHGYVAMAIVLEGVAAEFVGVGLITWLAMRRSPRRSTQSSAGAEPINRSGCRPFSGLCPCGRNPVLPAVDALLAGDLCPSGGQSDVSEPS